MENLDELEVMFQHINVTGASLVIPGGCRSQPTIDVGEDSYEGEEDQVAAADGNEQKKKGKRKAEDVVHVGKKKARNPMVRQVSRLIDVLNTGKQKKEQRDEVDIVEQIE